MSLEEKCVVICEDINNIEENFIFLLELITYFDRVPCSDFNFVWLYGGVQMKVVDFNFFVANMEEGLVSNINQLRFLSPQINCCRIKYITLSQSQNFAAQVHQVDFFGKVIEW